MILFALYALTACSTPPRPPAAAPAPAVAAEHVHAPGDHAHSSPHGGIVQTVGDIHVEALMMPGGVMFYLSDASQKAVGVDGYSGTAVVKGPNGVSTVTLMPMGDHLHAAVELAQGQPASAVLTLTHAGKAVSSSFENPSVGLQSHDHTSLHGGQVGMWGAHHVEYVGLNGEYQFWVTDEHRNPIATGLSGSVKDGETTLPLTVDAAGRMSARAEGAGTRPVTVDVTTGSETFSLAFNPAGPAHP